MAHRVFHDGLQGQRRQHEVRAANVVNDAQRVFKAHLFDIQIDLCMLQLLRERDLPIVLEGAHVALQIAGEFFRCLFGRLGVVFAKILDRGKCVIQEMRLDLAEHDLHPLPRFQIVLVLPHKPQMQPDIIEHAADHDGKGEKGDRLLQISRMFVQKSGYKDHQDDQHRNQQILFPSCAIIPHALIKQIRQQDQTDDQAGVAERPALVMVIWTDPKAQMGEERGHVDGPVHDCQRPAAQILLFRPNDIEKQEQEHRAEGIAQNGSGCAQHHARLAGGQIILQQILNDQHGAEEKDNSHDPTVFSADIRVAQHRDGQTDQHKAQRNQQGHCVQIPCHALSTPPS